MSDGSHPNRIGTAFPVSLEASACFPGLDGGRKTLRRCGACSQKEMQQAHTDAGTEMDEEMKLIASFRASAAALLTMGVLAAMPSASCATDPGYDIWFSGRVLAVEQQPALLRIARGPTETAAASVEMFTIARKRLKFVHPGMEIQALADTRHRPWRILRLRIYRHHLPVRRRRGRIALRGAGL